MLFGGGKDEKLNIEELSSCLNSAFDKKLQGLDSRASGIVKDLARAKLQFSEASNNFDRLDVEPEVENIYIHNSSVIKNQKGFYSTALKRILEEWFLSDENSHNTYEKYSNILSNTEKFLGELLKTNTSFQKVLRSYPDHLGTFKKPYSSIEKLTEALKTELEKAESELSEYNNINEKIGKLALLKVEEISLKKNLNTLTDPGSSEKDNVQTKETELSNSISLKETELQGLSSKIYAMESRIRSITIPLERSSRKFDHTNKGKRQLSSFITDPISNIRSESDYNEFAMLLNELKKSLGTGTIDLKNNIRVEQSISELLNSNVHNLITDLKTLQSKKAELQREINITKVTLDLLNKEKENSEKRIKETEHMKNSEAEISSRIKNAKTAIEGLFLEYYSRKVSVIVSD